MGSKVQTRERSVLRPNQVASSLTRARGTASSSFDSRARTVGFLAISGVLIVIAFVRGWQAVEGLQWPFDADLFRDIANAVTFKDGGVLSDAHYSGVPAWYSPFTSMLLWLGSLLTSRPIHRLGTQGGAVFNLVTPIALCLVTARWFGRRVAVLALVAYLFVIGGNYPSWEIASYSPWLYVNIYATGVFILALATVPAAVNRASTRDALLLGFAAGVVVLTHPATAVLLASVAAAQFLAAGWRASRPVLRRLALSAAISVTTALIVSAPFWLPIMVRYQWSVKNDAAGGYVSPELDHHHVWGFLREFAWRWPILVIAVGVPIWLVRKQSQNLRAKQHQPTRALTESPERRGPITVGGTTVLTAWTTFSFLCLLMEVYRDSTVLQMVPIPKAPSYHYLLSLTVALCIWFGIAINAIVRTVLYRRDSRWGAAAVTILVVGLSAWSVPSWKDRSDFVQGRDTSQAIQAYFDDFAVVDWIRQNTRPDEKFLNLGQGLVQGVMLPGLAGRKSVSVNFREFSNPFVDYDERQKVAQQMADALRACQLTQFERLAREHGHVRYVVTNAGSKVESACPDSVPTVYSDPAVSVQKIVVPSARA
jgi:hypothetical protein